MFAPLFKMSMVVVVFVFFALLLPSFEHSRYSADASINDGNAVSMSVAVKQSGDNYRLDLLTHPSEALVHPEIKTVTACVGRGHSCNGKNMIKRVLYDWEKKDATSVEIQSGSRMLFVPKESVPVFSGEIIHQFIQVRAALKHADGTLVKKEDCIVENGLDTAAVAAADSAQVTTVTIEKEEEHTQGAKAAQNIVNSIVKDKNGGLKWYMYTGMALGGLCMTAMFALFSVVVLKKINKYRNRPQVAYGGIYKFANDPTSREISKQEKERGEDFEIAKKLGLA